MDTTQSAGSHVYTLIPINHHAGGPTFTRCVVDAAQGSFLVGEAMLKPLAVGTGLEFQSIAHVRFAAAETPKGCVEFRFFVNHWIDLVCADSQCEGR